MVEATLGITPEDSVIQPMTLERREAFVAMVSEVEAIREAGLIVEIPFDS